MQSSHKLSKINLVSYNSTEFLADTQDR